MNASSKAANSSNIKVFCRFRPFNQKELEEKSENIHRISNKKQLIIRDPNKSEEQSFMFDHIFETNSSQEDIYKQVGMPVLTNILDGFNGTIMAYGQTSSGKTHTMQGYDLNDRDAKGIIPRIIENLFSSIEKSPQNLEFKLKVSIFEIYMEKVRDLLDVTKADLKIRENKNGPYVEHLTEAYISDRVEFFKLIHLGQKNRITCVTNMNAHSSRSHMIFLLTLNQFNSQTSQSKTSKLFLIDLAGSEKISKTGAEGKVLEQAKKINLSLTSLGKVIKSLSQRITHVPYRESKLTRIIKDSLGGNSKTTLIVTCSPHEIHISETISTLRFGQNAQKIKNKPKINRELTVEELQKIIEKLEASIEEKDHWIATLENYIKNDLNASLPQKVMKIPTKQHFQESLIESNTNNQMQNKEFEGSQDEEDEKQQEGIKNGGSLIQSVPINTSVYDQNIASLEAEINEYKKNLQSEVNKCYLLKKEYSSLNDNIKQLIEENLGYEEREKSSMEKMQKIREQILGEYQKSCALVFGQILDKCADCTGPQSCYGGIKEIVDEKGRGLIIEGQNINLADHWRHERQKLMKQIGQKVKEEMKEEGYSKKQGSKEEEQHAKEEQNKKIMEMEDKIDNLYHEYQEMLTLQTSWKVECQLYERKLKIKEEKICELRAMLKEITEQMEMMNDDYEDTVSVRSKIVKPIKGGFLFK